MGLFLYIYRSGPLGVSFNGNITEGLGSASVDNGMTVLQSKEPNAFFSNAFIANSPQLIVSFAYVFYNSLLTCMIMSREFETYATKRSGICVSSPKGYQRSTF